MDNYTSNGSGMESDTFGFVPPNMMYAPGSKDSFSSKEEMERYFYHLEHDNEFHIKDEPPADKFL